MSDTRDFDIEDTVILIDTSRSLARTDFHPNRFEILKTAAIKFVEEKGKIDPEDRYAIVTFNTDGTVVLEFTEDVQEAINSLKNLRIGGISSLGDGMGATIQLVGKKMQEEGDTASGGNVNRIVIFSDGNPSISSIDPIERGNVAAELGIIVDTVELSRISATAASSWGGILETLSILGEHYKVSSEEILTLTVKSLSHKKDVYELKKTIPKLSLIATDMIDLTNLNATQVEAVNQKMGLKIERCEICRQTVCKDHPENDCIRICPFCKVSLHSCCAVEWAKESKLEEAGVLRCPHCLLLLKVPVTLEEIPKPGAKPSAAKPAAPTAASKEEDAKPMLKSAETAEEGEFFKEGGRVKYKVTVGGEQLVIYLAWNNWGQTNYYCNIISGMNDKVVRDFQPIVDFNEGKCFGFRIIDDIGWFSKALKGSGIYDLNIDELHSWSSTINQDILFIKKLLEEHPEVAFSSDKILDYQLQAEVTFAQPLDVYDRDNLEGNLILGAISYLKLFRNRPEVMQEQVQAIPERPTPQIEGIEEVSQDQLTSLPPKPKAKPATPQSAPQSGFAAKLAGVDKIPIKELSMMTNTDERTLVKMLMKLIKTGQLKGYLKDGIFYRKK